MDKGFITGLIDVAQRVAPLVPYGEAAVKIALVVQEAMDEAKGTIALPDEDARLLEQSRQQLEAAVHAHATKTADSLR